MKEQDPGLTLKKPEKRTEPWTQTLNKTLESHRKTNGRQSQGSTDMERHSRYREQPCRGTEVPDCTGSIQSPMVACGVCVHYDNESRHNFCKVGPKWKVVS